MGARKGFTLIELMIVVIIVGILAAATGPAYHQFVSQAYETEVVAGLATIRTVARLYRTKHSVYPTHISDLTEDTPPLLSSEDFEDMRYIDFGDFSITGAAEDLEITWSGSIRGYDYSTVRMDGKGRVTRGG